MNNMQAIDILKAYMERLETSCSNQLDDDIKAFDLAIKAIKEDYKRPVGEWLPNYTSQFRNPGRQCSLCGKVVEFSENFCPKCGAKMILGGCKQW